MTVNTTFGSLRNRRCLAWRRGRRHIACYPIASALIRTLPTFFNSCLTCFSAGTVVQQPLFCARSRITSPTDSVQLTIPTVLRRIKCHAAIVTVSAVYIDITTASTLRTHLCCQHCCQQTEEKDNECFFHYLINCVNASAITAFSVIL